MEDRWRKRLLWWLREFSRMAGGGREWDLFLFSFDTDRPFGGLLICVVLVGLVAWLGPGPGILATVLLTFMVTTAHIRLDDEDEAGEP